MYVSRAPAILLILMLSIFGPLSTDMYLSGLPQMVVDFGTTEAVMNMSLYMFMLVLSFSILALGPVSDKYGRRDVLIATMAIYVGANIACYFIEDVTLFILFRMVMAFGGGGAMVSAYALIKDMFTGQGLSRMLSIVAVVGILGPILSPVIGTVLINSFGWRSTFAAPAAVAFTCLVLGLGIPASLPMERLSGSVVKSMMRVAAILRDKGFTLFMIMSTVFVSGQLAYIAVSSYIYQEKFGLSTTEYSIVLGVGCILGLILAYATRRLYLTNLQRVAMILVMGVASLIMMALIADFGWFAFMLAIVPCCCNNIVSRSFGFAILMGHHKGDNGSVSAAINFTAYMFAFAGMVIASTAPPDLFIMSIAVVLLISCVIFGAMWAILKRMGYPVHNLAD